jgi:hypothetical protein
LVFSCWFFLVGFPSLSPLNGGSPTADTMTIRIPTVSRIEEAA